MSLQSIEAFDRSPLRTKHERQTISATQTAPFGKGVPFGDVTAPRHARTA